MTIIIRYLLTQIFAAFPALFFCMPVSAQDSYVEFINHSKIHLSEPLTGTSRKLFEPGWGVAEFLNRKGEKIRLLPDEHLTSTGGAIFSPTEYWKISPSGKYAVLVVIRAGILGNPQDQEVTSRQYCPVLNTASGCLESIQSGEICAGDWDKKRDVWMVAGEQNDSTSIIRGLLSGNQNATEIWHDYSTNKISFINTKLQERLKDNLGVTNLLACDPVGAKNRGVYRLIADQLKAEGDIVGSIYVMQKLNTDDPSKDNIYSHKIANDKAWLYKEADISSKTSMYLIKGDLVRIINYQGEDWLFVDYKKSDDSHIRRWVQSKSVVVR
jgi:hypothetical protein